ncbi:MAG TPA: lipoate--protein ligase family protein [Chloroflexi bacterium]|nr:lipoate--protein ligase family protein [Chloroflexota bacterium]
MKLYDLGYVSWQDSQALYHTLPRIGREGLFILAPSSPYVSIGRHQDARYDVDLDYCRQHHTPVMRREVGGGAVYLDGNQIFYQLIIHRDNPLAPPRKDEFYERFLQAPIAAYRELGIDARYKPVNDIITAEGRKISGNGVAEIGDFIVFVGNLIVDFDYETMVRVLKVPDEKFRDKIYKTLKENLSTIKRELGYAPPFDELRKLLAAKFEGILGSLERVNEVDPELRAKTDEVSRWLFSEEWLLAGGRKKAPADRVKIREGVEVQHKVYKAPGGLIRAVYRLEEGRIYDVSLSGDFFFYPSEALEELEMALEGVALEDVEATIERFFASRGVEAPGITPGDFRMILAGEAA